MFAADLLSVVSFVSVEVIHVHKLKNPPMKFNFRPHLKYYVPQLKYRISQCTLMCKLWYFFSILTLDRVIKMCLVNASQTLELYVWWGKAYLPKLKMWPLFQRLKYCTKKICQISSCTLGPWTHIKLLQSRNFHKR